MKKVLVAIGLSVLVAGCTAKTAQPAQTSQAPSTNAASPVASAQPAASPDAMMQQNTPSDQEANANTIKISNFMFSPQTLTVKAGSDVTVTNSDTVQHNVVADDNSFSVDLLSENESSVFTAPTKPGTYTFHCAPHAAKMKGTLIVQ